MLALHMLHKADSIGELAAAVRAALQLRAGLQGCLPPRQVHDINMLYELRNAGQPLPALWADLWAPRCWLTHPRCLRAQTLQAVAKGARKGKKANRLESLQ